MYLNNKEGKIIGTFLGNLDDYENEKMLLRWGDGSEVLVNFDTCFDDDNDIEMEDENYEEFCSFAFEALKIKGTPPIKLYDGFFLVNYQNFPVEIFADGKKIN